jgi:hypothetical protein
MKKLLAIAFLLLLPSVALAAFPTQSVSDVSQGGKYYSRAKTGSSGLYVTSNFTWETRVKFDGFPASSQMELYGQSWKTGGNLSFLLQLDTTGGAGAYGVRVRMGSSGNQDKNIIVGAFALSTATWYDLAVVYTAASGKIEVFLNNVSQGSNSTFTTSIFNGTDIVTIGAEGDGSQSSNTNKVHFSLMRFWSTTRTALQLSTNKCTTLGSQANLGAEWTFDNTANDNSGNSNTLTPVGTPTYTSDVPAACAVSIPLQTLFQSFWW